MTSVFTLERNAYGQLVLTDAQGQTHTNVAPVRAFPIQAPQDGIALVAGDGREVAWIDHLEDLEEPARQLIQAELGAREFMPEIRRIVKVSSFAVPCTWFVETDRGDTQFVLRGEEDIRRIGLQGLLISDTHGIHFLLRDMTALDKTGKKILDRFL